MATLAFCDFEDALEALDGAQTEESVTSVVNQINQQFNAGTLQVEPEQWARLSSEVMLVVGRLRGWNCEYSEAEKASHEAARLTWA